MRRHVALIATVGLLLAAGLAACSDDGSSSSTDPTDAEAPDDSAPDQPVDDAAFDAVPVIEANPAPGGIASLPVWFLRADPVGDGDELRVVFPVREPCEMFDRVDVVETDDAVELTVLTWWSPTARCDPLHAWVRTTVPLAAPLGDREIRDGSENHPFRQGIDRIPEATDELFHVNSRPAEFALLTPDGNAVWATWRGGACDLLEGADVERDGDTVSVALRTGVEAEAQVCTANIVAWWTLVELDEPAAAVTYG